MKLNYFFYKRSWNFIYDNNHLFLNSFNDSISENGMELACKYLCRLVNLK